MAEPTLSLTYTDLQAEAGFFLGWGRGQTAPYSDPAWTTAQQQGIDAVLRSGLRTFYWPQLDGTTYDWSFMRPLGTFVLAQGASTVPCPDDYGGPEGQVTVRAVGSAVRVPYRLPVTGEGEVRAAYAGNPTMTGRPLLVAVPSVKGTTGAAGTRHQMYVFPTADQQYTLDLPYYVNGDYLSTAFPYHMGGTAHAETVLAAVLAAAELYQDDARGPRWAYYQERLKASVDADRRHKPETAGYNGDRSDARNFFRYPSDRHGWNYGGITVGGVQY